MYSKHAKKTRAPEITQMCAIPDPLDPDMAGDLPMPITLRQLARVALVAAEVGARFQRESIEHDPMAWMFAPRRLFGGRRAIEATLELDDCIRSILLHGLGMLDEDVAFIDDLRSVHPADESIDAAMRNHDLVA